MEAEITKDARSYAWRLFFVLAAIVGLALVVAVVTAVAKNIANRDLYAKRDAALRQAAMDEEMAVCAKAGLKTPYWDHWPNFFCADEKGQLFRFMPPSCNTQYLSYEKCQALIDEALR